MPRCLLSPPSRLRSFLGPLTLEEMGPGARKENSVKAFRLQVKTLVTSTHIPSFPQDVLQLFIKITLAQKLLLCSLRSHYPARSAPAGGEQAAVG